MSVDGQMGAQYNVLLLHKQELNFKCFSSNYINMCMSL